VDVIGGDVIWPAQFAASGFILDLSDRFTAGMREQYLDGPLEAVIYEGKIYGVPWFATPGCSTIAKISWRRAASPSLPRPGLR
jgi:multiple sugar transport system substrate-binding protein